MWVTLCRSLKLEALSIDSLLRLAYEDLQSLSLQKNHSFRPDPPCLQKVASLTKLTRLELKGLSKSSDEEIAALRNLQLQELVLLNCADLDLKLFVPGALTTLRKLHIENVNIVPIGSHHMMNEILLDEERDKLKAVGEIVFQLGELSQISGWCNLFKVGMRQGLREWNAADLPTGIMVSNTEMHCCPLRYMQLWTKSRS